MIDLIPAYGDKDLFLRMAKDYVETLAQYDPAIKWDEAAWMDAMWHCDLIVEDRTIQGFALVETRFFNVFPAALYIGEFYVVPEARKRGIGKETVKRITAGWNGDIYLYILHGNFVGRAFWLDIEHEYGWRRIQRPEIPEEENCELRVYQTTGEI